MPARRALGSPPRVHGAGHPPPRMHHGGTSTPGRRFASLMKPPASATVPSTGPDRSRYTVPMWRAASPDDHPVVIRFYLALNSEDPGFTPPEPARMSRTLTLFQTDPERGRCVVLDEGESAAGYALLVPYWSNELGGLMCCIDELYVSPPARGRGRAGDLLELLAGGALGWDDAIALQLGVSPANARARALYERHGFRPMRIATLVRPLGHTRDAV